MALSKEEILQAIEEMKVIELHELVEAIKEKFNVTAAMPVAAVAAPAAGGSFVFRNSRLNCLSAFFNGVFSFF